jgi:hypothetical protein
MTSKEFTIWLKGVIVGAAKFQPTSEQWKAIRDQVELINDDPVKSNVNLLYEKGTGTVNSTVPSYERFPYDVISAKSYVTLSPSGSNITTTL